MLNQKQIAYHSNCDGEIQSQSVSFALNIFICAASLVQKQ